MEEEGRRETWEETVDRYIGYMCDKQCEGKIPVETKEELRQAILNLEVMPSMRAMMTAGKALERNNLAGYNCAALVIDSPVAFDELLFLLMNGTGVGFSVERQFIAELPVVSEKFRLSKIVIEVDDSKEGWALAFRELISLLYAGSVPQWDLSGLRPAGARLRTFGGRASGSGPLDDLFKFTVDLFKTAAGRKLNSIECHDLCCKAAEAVVVGGVRRSACLSLSNPSDDRMRYAKNGEWWVTAAHRSLANNSIAYTEKPGMDVFMREWLALHESKSGERGIFNREGAKRHVAGFGRRDNKHDFILNPCAEVLLRNAQLCNLSEVVVRPDDTEESLMRKIRLASILGTMQATLTNFSYVREIWRRNTEEEALLGVSLTGIFDNPMTAGKGGKRKLADMLSKLRGHAVEVNVEWAKRLGINPSAAVTTVKPSGTVSSLCDSSSGIHPRFARYFIRRVRADLNDPLAKLMMDGGVPWEDDLHKKGNVVIFNFPMKSPDVSVVSEDVGAIDLLEIAKTYKESWTEHNVSLTVHLNDNEWMEVGAWTYRHFDAIAGISFLPRSHVYKQAPFEEVRKEEYDRMMMSMPAAVDWSKLSEYETEDKTTASGQLACSGGQCEIIDLTS